MTDSGHHRWMVPFHRRGQTPRRSVPHWQGQQIQQLNAGGFGSCVCLLPLWKWPPKKGWWIIHISSGKVVGAKLERIFSRKEKYPGCTRCHEDVRAPFHFLSYILSGHKICSLTCSSWMCKSLLLSRSLNPNASLSGMWAMTFHSSPPLMGWFICSK